MILEPQMAAEARHDDKQTSCPHASLSKTVLCGRPNTQLAPSQCRRCIFSFGVIQNNLALNTI